MNSNNVAKYFANPHSNNMELDSKLKLIPQMEGKCLITRENRRPHKVWLSYKIFGQGRNRVFLIPSSDLDELNLVKLIEYFGSSHQYQLCIYHSIYDSLNSLQVEFDQERINSLAWDYFGLLNFLGWSRCINLVGISSGCLIADRMGVLDPLRFSSLSLINHIPSNLSSFESNKMKKLNPSRPNFKEWSQKFNLGSWSKQLSSNNTSNKRNSKFIKLMHSATPIEDINASQVTIQSNLNPIIDIYGMCIDGMSKRRLKLFSSLESLNLCQKLDVNCNEEGYSDEYILLKGCDDLNLLTDPDSLNYILNAQFDNLPLDEYVKVPLISLGPKKWTLSYDETDKLKSSDTKSKKPSHKRNLSNTILRKRLSVFNIIPGFGGNSGNNSNNLKPLEKGQVY
ncbi:hypothetical protein CONCODRAFT_67312 [Conidiobolus coronatus NRRL 28638]|uniref:Alpha/beta-hydrolase n=1 Tax=Conidiobolus coronatus (strain ATCC 28846 / CBS 209.66 / NRRL 28638) TaxID=796925 RepID=A0A137PI44_CONC2|nr:hypothetical protein CONCODRAFT_67312 [Conidiobolus coronatus NRRL 28638]|eukprot:KXN74645.1 hypothetical protein CONCODRAFT_67312 [Conidiobolus coronatus NRRL 28638]